MSAPTGRRDQAGRRIFWARRKLLPRCPLGDTGGNRLSAGEDSVSSSGWRTSAGSPRLAPQFWAAPLQKNVCRDAQLFQNRCVQTASSTEPHTLDCLKPTPQGSQVSKTHLRKQSVWG